MKMLKLTLQFTFSMVNLMQNQNHNFIGGGLVWIVLEWTVAPLIALLCAFLLFALMKVSLLRHDNSEKRILVFLPIDYGISAGLLCLFLILQVKLYTYIKNCSLLLMIERAFEMLG